MVRFLLGVIIQELIIPFLIKKTTSEIIAMFALPSTKFYPYEIWEIAKEKMVWEKQDYQTESKSMQQADLLENGSLMPGRRFIDIADKMAMNLGFVISKENRIKLDIDSPIPPQERHTHPRLQPRRLKLKSELHSSSADLLTMLAASSVLDINEKPVNSMQTDSSLSQSSSSPVVSSLFASSPKRVPLLPPKTTEQETTLKYKT